jgi:alginate O-acetyltransferase complex protein AlgI
MLFTQLTFWIFFATVGALYVVLRHRAQNRMLLVASYVFYGVWDWRFLSLIFLSTCIDYVVARALGIQDDPQKRRRLLFTSLASNLGMLCIFKYLGFFADSFSDLLMLAGMTASPFTLSIVLPVGISFYTFQTLSYTIDVYRRNLAPEQNFWDFALFVAFFPQLVAGPIERASNLLPNITMPRVLSWDAFGRGTVLCLTGLIKKVVIADGISPAVDAIYSAPNPSGIDIALATWLFAVQIYCDFSGYTDIARGVAKMLGFGLMRNFAQPYFATNPQEFWRRWHISLSTWLRDYLYVSLGGNRGGRWMTYRNLMATMVLGGLWHGAAWNFILWGAFQGGLLSLHRALVGPTRQIGKGIVGLLVRAIAILLFFQTICYGWLLFRATSFGQIADFTQTLLAVGAVDYLQISVPTPPIGALVGMLALLLWDIGIERTGNPRFYDVLPSPLRGALYAAMIYLLAFGATTGTSGFIYFQF